MTRARRRPSRDAAPPASGNEPLDGGRQMAADYFHQITESIGEVFWIGTPDNRQVFYVSPAYDEIWGRPRAEMRKDPRAFLEAVLPEDRGRVTAALEQKPPGAYDIEYRIVRSESEIRWIRARGFPVRDERGEVYRIAGIAEDITDIKRTTAERDRLIRELEIERSRLFTLFEEAPAFIAVLRGHHHVFERANPRYFQLIGQRDIIGMPVREVFPEIEGQGYFELMDEVYRTGEPYIGRESRFLLRRSLDGPIEEVYLNFVYQPLVEADGSVSGIFAHGVDVTEQVRARREVERARDEAEIANRAKSDFLAVMSHELRTPLNAIIGYTDLLLAGVPVPLPPPSTDQVKRVRVSARHLIELIDQILTFSRIEAGRTEVHLEPVDLGEVIRDTADLVEPLARAKGLDFQVHVPVDPVQLETDTGKVRQILLNLLSNAIKFTGEGKIEISAEEWPERVIVRVRDTGIGISAKDRERIFDPFSQVERGRARREGGTGLGLSVTRSLVSLLGGELGVDSAPGKGSTFTFEISKSA